MSSFEHQDAMQREQERVDVSLAGFLYGLGLGVGIGVVLATFFS